MRPGVGLKKHQSLKITNIVFSFIFVKKNIPKNFFKWSTFFFQSPFPRTDWLPWGDLRMVGDGEENGEDHVAA